ncbi:MAG TPA: Ldh family oxidoreductase [Solirubrobacteraceae bacterium]
MTVDAGADRQAKVRLGSDEALQFAATLLRGAGISWPSALIVARHLIDSDRRGLPSHGLMRIAQYAAELEEGEIDGQAVPSVVRRDGALVMIDGEYAPGQVAGEMAVQEALGGAALHRIGIAVVRRAGHAGRIGAYVEPIAAAGHVGMAFCSGPRSGHRVAPFRGVEGRLATNPIAFAFPGDQGPVVADFSTSTIPEGVARRLRDLGLPAPDDALQSADGSPTSDPEVLYGDPPGTLLPLGGARFGHKGFALGLLVEAMTTALAGEDATDGTRVGNNLTVAAVAGDEQTRESGRALAAYVRTSRAADPDRPVLLPGDPERLALEGDDAVRLDRTTWDALCAVAESQGVSAPVPSPRLER